MFRKTSLLYLFLILFVIAGCKEDEPTPEAVKPTEQPVSTPEDSQDVESDEPDFPIQETGVFISELLPGVPGGNNREFIELYNAGDIPVDLQGWSLWYSLGSGQEESELITWDEPTLIPSNGHILLVRSNNDFGIIPDGVFDVSLFERKGGVALRDSQGASVDLVGWGDAAEGFYAGTPAAVPEDGASLERLPGGVDGNGVSSGDNSADFFAQTAPDPQNSGSSPTPGQTNQLSIHLEAPISVQPGEEFVYLVRVENHSGQDASGVIASIPVPPGYGVIELPDGAREVDSRIEWPVGDLPDGESTIGNILLRSPFTYSDALVRGYYVEADAVPAVFGPLRYVSVAGGSIPVVNARELVGNIVTVEGTATMYTGGFFAGTTGTKFYMEDETGGIQVYVPGGAGLVDVSIGDRVRVTGEIEPYRDSLELVPGDIPADIEILEPGAAEPAPSPITVADNERNDAVIGMLNVIEGTVTQIEELTYDYQLQLMDESGESTLVLIEKQTGVTAEPLDVGQQYKITGISEYYSGAKQIKPRLQSDLEQVFPPVLMLELKAANSVLPGEVLTYTITATNYKPEELTDVHIVANLPELEREFLYLLLDGGYELDESVVWIVDRLEPNGGSAEVRFTLQLGDEEALENETIVAKSAIATASGQMTEWVESDGYLTFIAGGVPIWAIQGSGDRSPYARTEATTEGIVTGVFPDLGGFWIQEIVNDYDPTTSSGLFVMMTPGEDEQVDIPVALGDLIQLTGLVREISGQTTLHLLSAEDVEIVSSDNPLPTPVDYDPPQDPVQAQTYKEALEGMLVTVREPAVAIGPTTRYGEYVLIRNSWNMDSVRRGENAGHFIFVDDGSDAAHESQATLDSEPVARGDIVSGVTGPLAYTFEQYKIEPITEVGIITKERSEPSLPPTNANEFSVATFNVENLFDLLDPHPASPPQPTLYEYQAKLNKIADAIVAMGAPTIIGLQEVENLDILEDLVELEQLEIYEYTPYLLDAADERGIDVGFIVRSDRATVEGFNHYPAPEGLTSRWPLVISTTVHLSQGDENVYVINNHLSSLSSGEEATLPRRTAQAAWSAELVERMREADPDGHFIVLGDLNSFIDTPPLDVLEEAGLRHVYRFFESEEEWPYTYVFQGATQSLDHILVSEELFTKLYLVDTLKIDADYPIMDPDDSAFWHLSDHDPLVAYFSFDESN